MADSNKELTLNYQIKTNSLEINDRTDRFSAIGNRACQICTMLEVNETLENFKKEFPSHRQCRDWVISKYKEILGNKSFDEDTYSDNNGLGFFLGLMSSLSRNH